MKLTEPQEQALNRSPPRKTRKESMKKITRLLIKQAKGREVVSKL